MANSSHMTDCYEGMGQSANATEYTNNSYDVLISRYGKGALKTTWNNIEIFILERLLNREKLRLSSRLRVGGRRLSWKNNHGLNLSKALNRTNTIARRNEFGSNLGTPFVNIFLLNNKLSNSMICKHSIWILTQMHGWLCLLFKSLIHQNAILFSVRVKET